MNLTAVILPESLGSVNLLFHNVKEDKSSNECITFSCDDGGNVDITKKESITVVLHGNSNLNAKIRRDLLEEISIKRPEGDEIGNFFSHNPLLGQFRTFQVLYVKDGSFYLISKLFQEDTDFKFAKLSTGITILR